MCAARYSMNRVTCLWIGAKRKSTGRKLLVDIALLKFCKQLHRSQFLVRLQKELYALLALSLIQVLRENIDVGMSEFFAWLQVWRAFQNGNNFFWQFVAWVLADHISYVRQIVHG